MAQASERIWILIFQNLPDFFAAARRDLLNLLANGGSPAGIW